MSEFNRKQSIEKEFEKYKKLNKNFYHSILSNFHDLEKANNQIIERIKEFDDLRNETFDNRENDLYSKKIRKIKNNLENEKKSIEKKNKEIQKMKDNYIREMNLMEKFFKLYEINYIESDNHKNLFKKNNKIEKLLQEFNQIENIYEKKIFHNLKKEFEEKIEELKNNYHKKNNELEGTKKNLENKIEELQIKNKKLEEKINEFENNKNIKNIKSHETFITQLNNIFNEIQLLIEKSNISDINIKKENYKNCKQKLKETKGKKDGTYDFKTGEILNYKKGYQVAFETNLKNADNYYSDHQYDSLIYKLSILTKGKVCMGVFNNNPEISFYIENKILAMTVAAIFNQECVFDWNNNELLFNPFH